MNNHQDLDSMIAYIYESIKRDCEHFIMMNRMSLGLLPKIEIKLDLDDVIWWNLPILLYAIKRLKAYKIDKYPYDYDWGFVFTMCRIFKLDQGKDVTLWGEALRYFKMNYTEELKISKWNVSHITKEMAPNMDDDEIRYANNMWNAIFGDKPPCTSDFNNIKPKNSWLERKTKRRK